MPISNAIGAGWGLAKGSTKDIYRREFGRQRETYGKHSRTHLYLFPSNAPQDGMLPSGMRTGLCHRSGEDFNDRFYSMTPVTFSNDPAISNRHISFRSQYKKLYVLPSAHNLLHDILPFCGESKSNRVSLVRILLTILRLSMVSKVVSPDLLLEKRVGLASH